MPYPYEQTGSFLFNVQPFDYQNGLAQAQAANSQKGGSQSQQGYQDPLKGVFRKDDMFQTGVPEEEQLWDMSAQLRSMHLEALEKGVDLTRPDFRNPEQLNAAKLFQQGVTALQEKANALRIGREAAKDMNDLRQKGYSMEGTGYNPNARAAQLQDTDGMYNVQNAVFGLVEEFNNRIKTFTNQGDLQRAEQERATFQQNIAGAVGQLQQEYGLDPAMAQQLADQAQSMVHGNAFDDKYGEANRKRQHELGLEGTKHGNRMELEKERAKRQKSVASYKSGLAKRLKDYGGNGGESGYYAERIRRVQDMGESELMGPFEDGKDTEIDDSFNGIEIGAYYDVDELGTQTKKNEVITGIAKGADGTLMLYTNRDKAPQQIDVMDLIDLLPEKQKDKVYKELVKDGTIIDNGEWDDLFDDEEEQEVEDDDGI